MTGRLQKLAFRVARAMKSLRWDTRGNIAILFAFASTALVIGVGAGIDMSRAYLARQKLSEVATLTCQFSTRPSAFEGATQSFPATVNAYAASALASQNWPASNLPTGGPTGTATSYFTPTSSASSEVTTGVAELWFNVPTLFLKIINVTQIPVHAVVSCQPTTPGSDPNTPGKESWEKGGTPGSYVFISPGGSYGTSSTPSQTFPSAPGYTGSGGLNWYIMGYCLEIDSVGVISSTVPDGSYSAELDCDNGHGGGGNSSISTNYTFSAGYYEIRYSYRSRVDYPNYDPTYICGSAADDVKWANDTSGGSLRTNQINVYLDQNVNGAAPTHATIDNSQQLAGKNLIDMCVYSPTWIQRSIKVKITTAGLYWLTLAADGNNDSLGGQIDNLLVCKNGCSGTPQDNFPSMWVASNNGNVNKLLFEDTFESPGYSQDPYTSSAHAKGGNLAKSYGKTNQSSCNNLIVSSPGWPCQAATGWAVAPYNEAVYWMQGATQGSQYISLQGWNPGTSADISTYGYTNSGDPINRAISRPFLLDPGYYNVQYDYVSMVDFSYDFVYGINCYYKGTSGYSYNTTPGGSYSYNLWGQKHGYDYGSSTLYSQYMSTNIVQTYMAIGQSISTPSVNSTLGGAPTYTNPDNSVGSPTVPPDNGSVFASNNASISVIDACAYSSGYAWINRSTNVKITKPGIYWLTFSSQGDPLTGLGAGAGIDDVRLAAIGSPMMNPPVSNPPTTPALFTIPVPDPQPDSNNTGTYNGFYMINDPFMWTTASP